MNDLNIAKIIVNKRRKMNVTQEEIASFVGVTKASVSKWETKQSYPDITLLPKLATFFNISIDELIGYEKQMTSMDIQKEYKKFAKRFSNEEFDKVYEDIKKVISDYYSCFPLLMQMSVLMLNHYYLAAESEREKVLSNIIELSNRIKENSEDADLMKQADYIKSVIYLQKGEASKVIDILGEKCKILYSEAPLLSQAFMILQDNDKADEILQVSMYQYLLGFLGGISNELMIHSKNLKKVSEILKRTIAISKLYNLEKLHPNTMLGIYLTAANVYIINNKKDECLKYLRMYSDIAINLFPLSLHGDDYFDNIDNWFKEFPLGNMAPTDENTVKNNLINGIENNPLFISIKGEKEYLQIINNLKLTIGSDFKYE